MKSIIKSQYKALICSAILAICSISIAPLSAEEVKATQTEEAAIAALNSNEPAAQVIACRNLGILKAEKAISPLINLLKNSPDREVQWNAAMALGMIGKAGPATDALLDAAKNSPSKSVRYASLVGLANIQDDDKKEQAKAVAQWTLDSSDDELAKDLVQHAKEKLGDK